MPVDVEALKQRKNGLDIWKDIEGWATTGYDSIPEDEFELFKWYGLYRQRPNVGHFMIRVRLPGGFYNARQAREIASLSRAYGRGTLDVTTRQNFQIHWLELEHIPEFVSRLHSVGLTTTMTCGDVPRNIIGCPLAGRDADEWVDAHPVIQDLNRELVGNRDFANLPRKYKMSLSGCAIRCALPEINDVGMYGAHRQSGGKVEPGFNLMVGGGLSARPFLAKFLNAFVPIDHAVDVCVRITEIFRDMGPRKSRSKARLKFLVEAMGAEAFRAELVKRLGHDLDPAVEAPLNPHAFRDHVGVGRQKEEGMHYLGLTTTSGRLTPADLFVLADVAEEFGSGKLANSCMQNVLLLDIPEDKLQEVQDRLRNAPTLAFRPSHTRAGTVVCTGIEFCNLAVVETKNRSLPFMDYLEKEAPLDVPLKISISGCPNSCSQFHAADIGLRGVNTTVDGEKVEAFDIMCGTRLGQDGAFGQFVERKVPAAEIGPKVAGLINRFRAERTDGESFHEFIRRTQAAYVI